MPIKPIPPELTNLPPLKVKIHRSSARKCAEKIWHKMEKLMVVDTDGLDPRQENAINQIQMLIQQALDNQSSNSRYDRREGEFRRGDPGHPDNEMGM